MRKRNSVVLAGVAVSLGGLLAVGGTTTAVADPTLGLEISNASDTDNFTNNEITLAVNPTDHDNLIIGDNDYDFNDGCGVNFSRDGGSTWGTHSFIRGITKYTNDPDVPGTGKYDFGGDPAVTFGPDGTAYFACYGYLVHGTFNEVVLYVSRSTDGGETWSARPAAVTSCQCSGEGKGATLGGNGQFPDHEAITADRWPNSPHYGRIYVTQAQFHGSGPSPIQMFWSDDGIHWSKPVEVSHSPLKRNQDAIPAVGPDGSVYVTFDNQHSQHNNGNNTYSQTVYIAKSTNGGQSFGPDYQVVRWLDPVDRDLANSDYRASSYAVPGVDSSNRLSVVWNDRRTGASQAFVQRANAADISQGRSAWTTPMRLHPSDHQQFFPWLSVAPNGRVDVVFYDRTADPDDALNFVTYAALTPTGSGLDVTKFIRQVTPAVASDGLDGNEPSPPGQLTTGCGAFIGDYIGIASTDDDVFLGWTDNGAVNETDWDGEDFGCDVNEDDFSAHLTYQ
jgi:hypothetical protein